MKTRILNWWEALHGSYWFLPTLMCLAAIGAAFGVVQVDQGFEREYLRMVGWVWAGSAEGGRTMLSTIASSMVTVAGVVFSITIVALTLASSQFGPRLLRNFMRDRSNQFVLGTFLSTYLYCLLVLRSIRGQEETTFVPYLAVTLGIVLAVVSVGVLIYFIHHVAESIQVGNLVAAVARELHEGVERLFPEQIGHGGPEERERPEEIPEDFESRARTIVAQQSGYVQVIAEESIMEAAEKHDLLLALRHRPGSFVAEGETVLRAWPPESCDDDLAKKLRDTVILGRRRTATQNIEFTIDQLVEIALRAISPGINDPFTALTCIDWLGAGFSQIVQRRIPAGYRFGEDDRLRIITATPTFAGLTDSAFNQIRQFGRGIPSVAIRLLEVIANLGTLAQRPSDRAVLREHAEWIRADFSEADNPNGRDHADVRERYERAMEVLGEA